MSALLPGVIASRQLVDLYNVEINVIRPREILSVWIFPFLFVRFHRLFFTHRHTPESHSFDYFLAREQYVNPFHATMYSCHFALLRRDYPETKGMNSNEVELNREWIFLTVPSQCHLWNKFFTTGTIETSRTNCWTLNFCQLQTKELVYHFQR